MPTATTAAPIATIAQTAIIPTGKPAAVTPCEDACTTMSCTTIVEMPKEFVTFRVTWYVPDAVYCFDVCHPAPYVPSPKSQWYTREPVRSQLPFDVNVEFSNAWIEFGDTLKAAIGWETAVISEVVVAANPSSSTTARRTVYLPGWVYRWLSAAPSPTAPSPNCHT